MCWVFLILFAFGLIPWFKAWQATRNTTLRASIGWGIAAWLAWIGHAGDCLLRHGSDGGLTAYLGLCLSGCAGIAVLGARRPGVAAWNFVVVGLLAVFLLQILEGLDHLRHSPVRAVFLAGTLAVAALNYLPTRLMPVAMLVAIAFMVKFSRLICPESWQERLEEIAWVSDLALALAPCAAWLALRYRRPAASEFDRTWLDFRDRFGLVWGQRLREQFNRSAEHAGWPHRLGWNGLVRMSSSPADEEMLATLRALMKRFGPAE